MKTTVATHDGPFHLDELIAVAALDVVRGPLEVIRTRDPRAVAAADIAVDVGGGAFDHHQPGGNGIRPNGIPYASAGLVWQAYGPSICGDSEVARRVDERFIQSIDAADTGIDLLGPPTHASGARPITLQTMFTWFNPVNGTSEDYDRAFHDALALAKTILDRAIEAARQSVESDGNQWAPGFVQAVATTSAIYTLDKLIAFAVLDYVRSPLEIIRTRDPRAITNTDIAVDVGGGAFDHHQPGGNGIRPNGIPYASAGLVWQAYGPTICGDPEVARRVDERFIQSIDAADTGIDLLGPPTHASGARPITLQTIITWFNPVNGASEDYDRAFHDALALAKTILDRAIEAARQSVKADRVISAAIDRWRMSGSPAIIVFDQWAPGCVQAAATTSAIYALFPDTKNGWRVQAVPETPTSRISRKPLPETWRGLQAEDLANVSGVNDAIFCHPSGFIAGAQSFEGAWQLAATALQPEGGHHETV